MRSGPTYGGLCSEDKGCALEMEDHQDDRLALTTECYICYIGAMNRTITQHELRDDSARVLHAVQAGEMMVVTRNGVSVAELRPVPLRRFVPRATIALVATQAPRVEARRLRADIDAVVDPGIDG